METQREKVKMNSMGSRSILLLTSCALMLGDLICGTNAYSQSTPDPASNAVMEQISNTSSNTHPETLSQEKAEKQPENNTVGKSPDKVSQIYRLVRIIIPSDSPHSKELGDTPQLYIVILENGVKIKTGYIFSSSYNGTGQQVEFPDVPGNTWKLDPNPKVTYTLQLWSDDWGWSTWNTLVMSKANLKMSDFNEPILEDISQNYTGDCQIKFEFEKK